MLLEEEEDCEGGELSDEKKAIKKLLLSKGAKTAEERGWKRPKKSARWARGEFEVQNLRKRFMI